MIRRLGGPGMHGAGGMPLVSMGGGCPSAGNGLLNNLIAYWPGNEVAGDALDLHTNALHLTDVNTVTSLAGWVYPLARQYTNANNEYHTRLGDDALLSTGDVDFTIATWATFDSLTDNRVIVSKYEPVVGGREYLLRYNRTSSRFRFYISSNGTVLTTLDANAFGPPNINTWYMIIVYHDSVANRIGIKVNQIEDTLNYALGCFDSSRAFRIGWWVSAGDPDEMSGRIHATGFWKSAAGGGGVLTASQQDALWNGGAGLPYSAFTY